MANETKTIEPRVHRTYRIADTPYFKAQKNAKKFGTTLSNLLEDVACVVANKPAADVQQLINQLTQIQNRKHAKRPANKGANKG